MSIELKIVLISSLMTFLGVVGNAMILRYRSQSETRAQDVKTESETIGWYRNLLEDTQKRYDEIEQQNIDIKTRLKEEMEAHAIALSNMQAVMVKRQAEYDERVSVERNRRKKAEQEVTYYVLNRNELVRLLRRHAPNVAIPDVDMNGSSTPT